MNKKDKVTLLNWIVYLLVFLLVTIIVSWSNHVKLGDVDVLAFIGSIIGGILTLAGVYFTIQSSFNALEVTMKRQENLTFKETMGTKLTQLYKVKGIIYEVARKLENRKYGWNDDLVIEDIEKINQKIFCFLFPNLNPLLEYSSAVDYEFYEDIKNFVTEIRKFIYEMDDNACEKLKNAVDKLVDLIEIHETRLGEKFKNASHQQ
jgi:hypothetical protein